MWHLECQKIFCVYSFLFQYILHAYKTEESSCHILVSPPVAGAVACYLVQCPWWGQEDSRLVPFLIFILDRSCAPGPYVCSSSAFWRITMAPSPKASQTFWSSLVRVTCPSTCENRSLLCQCENLGSRELPAPPAKADNFCLYLFPRIYGSFPGSWGYEDFLS